MKKLVLALTILGLVSCGPSGQYELEAQEILNGVVSAKKRGNRSAYNSFSPTIWVQTPTSTKKLSIPFEYETKWKVGDSITIVVQKYYKVEK